MFKAFTDTKKKNGFVDKKAFEKKRPTLGVDWKASYVVSPGGYVVSLELFPRRRRCWTIISSSPSRRRRFIISLLEAEMLDNYTYTVLLSHLCIIPHPRPLHLHHQTTPVEPFFRRVAVRPFSFRHAFSRSSLFRFGRGSGFPIRPSRTSLPRETQVRLRVNLCSWWRRRWTSGSPLLPGFRNCRVCGSPLLVCILIVVISTARTVDAVRVCHFGRLTPTPDCPARR